MVRYARECSARGDPERSAPPQGQRHRESTTNPTADLPEHHPIIGEERWLRGRRAGVTPGTCERATGRESARGRGAGRREGGSSSRPRTIPDAALALGGVCGQAAAQAAAVRYGRWRTGQPARAVRRRLLSGTVARDCYATAAVSGVAEEWPSAVGVSLRRPPHKPYRYHARRCTP